MSILELTSIVFGGALLAGLIGSLTGLGGGIIPTPLLTVVLGVAGAARLAAFAVQRDSLYVVVTVVVLGVLTFRMTGGSL